MMMMGTSSSSSNNQTQTPPNVFTASQLEELEQQALLYKYMVSGVPVPTDLILAVRRSLYTSSPSSSLSHHPTLGGVWEGPSFPYNQLYQMSGYGRKIDLEPGRCRRTDGKKWRCSKEAYPDSKYCERHMHRGRNRSRKPVEFTSSSSSSVTATTLNVSSSSSPSSAISKSTLNVSSDPYPSFSSVHTTFLDSSPYSHQTLQDYRNLQGMKDLGEDERPAAPYFQLNDHHHHQTYSHFSFQNLKDHQKKEDQETQGQHCFVMGTDFIKPSHESNKSSSIQIDTKANATTSTQQPFHHFFSSPKTTLNNPNPNPDWVNVDTKAPLSTQDLFQSKPRPYW
ncbi:uncharacterized protein LOC143589825 [Bidens hawaiensis]|uniref:uncharacterized protein LOC143589825 n=1 Tax=Bidens hawaiensis TaxID=980011 RepID=UPI00404A9D98